MHFDHIVIGLGSMGSAALYHLSKRGKSVLGLEQFHSPHENGSHGGQSRIIRMAYYEHPNYIPLLQKAYQNWVALEEESGVNIFYRTGLYYAGPKEHEIIRNVKLASSAFNIELQPYDHQQIFVPDQWDHFLEPDAGFIRPELSVKTHLELAAIHGAAIMQQTQVLDWKREGALVKVITNKGEFFCKKLVITAGPWASSLISGIEKNFEVTRQLLTWINVPKKDSYSPQHFPSWFIMEENKPGAYYGFPYLNKDSFGSQEGLKLAYHYPGEVTDPDHVDRNIKQSELDEVREFVSKYFKIDPEILSSKICLYSNTPDEHFVIDNMPGMEEHVCFAWGFSGHGFKFVSAVGEILADLAIEGSTSLPIEFLNAGRF